MERRIVRIAMPPYDALVTLSSAAVVIPTELACRLADDAGRRASRERVPAMRQEVCS
jgi:hypothetical protein